MTGTGISHDGTLGNKPFDGAHYSYIPLNFVTMYIQSRHRAIRRIPDSWIRLYASGVSTVIIGLPSHPSKSGTMHLATRKMYRQDGWDKRQWREAKGLEIDLFFMGVKRLPKIINI